MTSNGLWRRVHVALAALAMVATLPGRTHGLGLFTEPIRATFGLDEEAYGFLNLVATLVGAVFCFPVGWLLDRVGPRAVLAGVTVSLGAVVVLMSRATGLGWVHVTSSLILPLDLFLLVMLTRGFGQSALSVASLSLIARSVGKREGLAMGAYAFLTTVGFITAFSVLRVVINLDPSGWRLPWAGIGAWVAMSAVAFWLLIDNRVFDATPPGGPLAPRAGGARHPGEREQATAAAPDSRSESATRSDSATLGQALRTPTFWVFALATSFYGMVAAGTSLFGEKLLAERGLSKDVFLTVTIVGIPAGLAANLLGGWLATRQSLSYVLAGAMALMAANLVWFPYLTGEVTAYLYAAGMAAAGGVVTVTFFTVWRKAFGLSHLGRIQGAAQFLTVLFSAIGPQLFGSAATRLGGFAPIFPYLAAAAAALGLAAVFVRVPVKEAA